MKTEKNILIAFLLNMSFSIFEFIGGIFTNSVSIISDAVHDLGDSLSIAISFLLEKKSKKNPDNYYTYGYQRFSILGALFTTIILIIGSIFVIIEGIERLNNPVIINYDGMIIMAVIGFTLNLIAAFITSGGKSLNQKVISLHMLEDVLGWLVVLIGSVLIKIFNMPIIDSIMSLMVALFILISAFKNLLKELEIILERIPRDLNIEQIKSELMEIEHIINVHHIHAWSLTGEDKLVNVHIVTDHKDYSLIKKQVRNKLNHLGVTHVTIELENELEKCDELECKIKESKTNLHHHHHHH